MDQAMTLALQEARLAAQEGQIPVGAVLVKNGQIICAAHNRRQQHHDPTAHAQMLCIRQASQLLGDWRLNDCTLYVTLEPCPMCAGTILMSRISRVVFGADDPDQGCCGSVYDLPADPTLHGTTQWQQGEGATEAKALLQDFFSRRR